MKSDYDVCVVVDANANVEEAQWGVIARSYEIFDLYEDIGGGPFIIGKSRSTYRIHWSVESSGKREYACYERFPTNSAKALANIREAIQEYLAARDELPQDSETREVDVPV